MSDNKEEWTSSDPMVDPPTDTFVDRVRMYQASRDQGARARSIDPENRAPQGHGSAQASAPKRTYKDNSVKKVLYVPSRKVGRIIGKGGSKIRELRGESQARIYVGDSNGNETDVTLIGTEEAITKAETAIVQLIDDRKP